MLLSPNGSNAHGYLALPKSRNYIANSNYCPHCLNAGGVQKTKQGATYPESRHGACGDPWDEPKDHEQGGKFAKNIVSGRYKEGETIDLATAIATYHKGAIEYRICRFPVKTHEHTALTEACFEENVLRSPYDTTWDSRWTYLGTGEEAGYWPPRLYKSSLRLPKGLTCDGETYKCVLQMHWITGNTCNDPRIPPNHQLEYLRPCGEDDLWPEEFWNCADIVIE